MLIVGGELGEDAAGRVSEQVSAQGMSGGESGLTERAPVFLSQIKGLLGQTGEQCEGSRGAAEIGGVYWRGAMKRLTRYKARAGRNSARRSPEDCHGSFRNIPQKTEKLSCGQH